MLVCSSGMNCFVDEGGLTGYTQSLPVSLLVALWLFVVVSRLLETPPLCALFS
jgi:hypothetical protein